jgi:16S rRNA (cytidine1402-2'-O)-methyltransferase
MSGALYLIPNLLGNADEAAAASLTDAIPPAVLAKAASLDYYVAENAKSTRAFLKRIAAHTPLRVPLQEIRIVELNVNTAPGSLPAMLKPLRSGRDAGLISDAGVPAVADPGADLVRLAHREGITVKPLVGPSSLLLAVMAGGLGGQNFAFNGYLPTDAGTRTQRIRFFEERSRREGQTQLFIETPFRNQALLEALLSACRADTLLSIAVDLGLPGEAIRTASIGQWKQAIKEGSAPALQKRFAVFSLLAC